MSDVPHVCVRVCIDEFYLEKYVSRVVPKQALTRMEEINAGVAMQSLSIAKKQLVNSSVVLT